MNLRQFFLAPLLLSCHLLHAQTDTVKQLNQITIKGYNNPQPWLKAVNAISLIDSNQLALHPKSSLLNALNTVAGVTMEERSPGSYRLSLRGSLLRSPFGIRNIKIYLNDLPLTDAGGNTYLNLIDAHAIQNIEIFKGPDASIYGANTGGTILINTHLSAKDEVKSNTTFGSYGLFHQALNLNKVSRKHVFNLSTAYQKSEGYRAQSALDRKYIQFRNEWNYHPKGQISLFSFYSDLGYETPGGLTLAQMQNNPKAARLATTTLPSAITQQAAIYNKTLYGGITHRHKFSPSLQHVIAIFGSHTDFKNPFITNYEERKEQTIGYRSYLAYGKSSAQLNYQIQGGIESNNSANKIANHLNMGGTKGNLTASDNLVAKQQIAFLRLNVALQEEFLLELGSGLNFYQLEYESTFPNLVPSANKKLKTSFMPKLALSYTLHTQTVLRASASKGFSPPTIAEVRSSDQQINSNLQAEQGWNYELGARFQSRNKRFYTDLSLYHFQLKDAIVRRINANDEEYFVNAGGTKQMGIEWQNSFWLFQAAQAGLIRSVQLQNSFNYANYTFKNFKNGNENFSGNTLTGTPSYRIVSSTNFSFPAQFNFWLSHNYTSRIALNDANTVYAKAYHLMDLKIQKSKIMLAKMELSTSLFINNLLNINYSLGNDLNAAGNRFYNPAMKRNYQFALQLQF